MSALTHDPEAPFVFRFSEGDVPLAKFRHKHDADAFAENYAYGSVTDTTPKVLPTRAGLYALGDGATPGTRKYVALTTDGRWFKVDFTVAPELAVPIDEQNSLLRIYDLIPVVV